MTPIPVSPGLRRLVLGGLGVAALVACFWMLGCAVGKTASGEAVVGVPVGISPDADALQATGAAIGGLLGGPGGAAIGGTAAAALAGLVGLWARSAGRHKGWEEREKAATVQAPLGGGTHVGGPAAAHAGAAEAGVVRTGAST